MTKADQIKEVNAILDKAITAAQEEIKKLKTVDDLHVRFDPYEAAREADLIKWDAQANKNAAGGNKWTKFRESQWIKSIAKDRAILRNITDRIHQCRLNVANLTTGATAIDKLVEETKKAMAVGNVTLAKIRIQKAISISTKAMQEFAVLQVLEIEVEQMISLEKQFFVKEAAANKRYP